jgi:hypothetical protein
MKKYSIEDCPFCEGEFDGCCFCDHTGKVRVGEGEVFETIEDMKPIQVDKPLEADLRKVIDRETMLKANQQ